MAWQVTNVSAGAGTATATLAAGGSTCKWVVTSITASLAAAAAAQTPLSVTVVQDVAGTPLTLWSAVLAAPVDGSAFISTGNIWIQQTVPGKTLTIAFSGNGVAGALQSVSMSGGASS